MEIKAEGFAFGQIADMQKWFAQLKASGKITADKQLTVSGYSLGGHLATAFNLLHGNDLTSFGAPLIAATYTFNRAGVGMVARGYTLAQVMADFTSHRALGSNADLFQRSAVRERYNRLKDVFKEGATITAAQVTDEIGQLEQIGFVDEEMSILSEALERERARIVDERKGRYEKAKALFDERCKTAGEKIYRIVDNVEGVLLLKVRPSAKDADFNDPYWPDAGLPQQFGGEDYIQSFIAWEHQQRRPERGYLNSHPTDGEKYVTLPGYTFVDVTEDDGAIYRYRFEKPPSSAMRKERLHGTPARYAVSFRNLVNHQGDRTHWVAGTTVMITDTQSKEVVAEKTWYSSEPGLGSRAGARTPWVSATTCPGLREGEAMRFPTRFLLIRF